MVRRDMSGFAPIGVSRTDLRPAPNAIALPPAGCQFSGKPTATKKRCCMSNFAGERAAVKLHSSRASVGGVAEEHRLGTPDWRALQSLRCRSISWERGTAAVDATGGLFSVNSLYKSTSFVFGVREASRLAQVIRRAEYGPAKRLVVLCGPAAASSSECSSSPKKKAVSPR